MNRRKIAIVGGGAAGFAAAITAAREGCDVTVVEAAERVGNSIKVTGDGRCNIANSRTSAGLYWNGDFVGRAFSRVSPWDALDFLESCGLMLREESQGRLYPLANKSTSVIDALRLSAEREGVCELCGERVVSLEPRAGAWRLRTESGWVRTFDAVVAACGGTKVPEGFLPDGVRVFPQRPLLGPMKTSSQALKGLDKVRAKCSVTVGDRTEDGEVTFRAYGISGIAAFNMTRFARKGDTVRLDFLSQLGKDTSLPLLERRLHALDPFDWLQLTCGMLLPLVARAVLRQAGIAPDSEPRPCDLPAFDRVLRGFELEYLGIGDQKLCQVHRGGVCVSQVDPASMGIEGYPGLHCAGELLDVDGPCGGYNLHWAWVSGIIAGKAVAHD
ncbi:MAG: aminoacetone oxidase family FAD-binding enzyme [Eggerthellaceae bacterium]